MTTNDSTLTMAEEENFPSSTNEVLGMLSDSQRDDANSLLLIVRYVFIALSLPVTVCNVIVFLQRSMRSATSVYILGLSFAQIFFLCAHIGLVLWSGLVIDPRRGSSAYCIYSVYAIAFGSVIARRGSYVILCFVSMERLYAIVRPLHVKEFVLSKHSILVMVGTYLVTTAWHLYLPAKLTVGMAVEEATESVSCQTNVTELYLRHKDVNDTFSLAVKVVMTYMALILQIVLNVLTVYALRRHNQAAKRVQVSANEEARHQRERQLTVTILVTTVAYVVLSLPACLNGLLNMVVPVFSQQGRYRNLASVVYHVCLDLQILSCSVDFVCFFALSSNYRRTFFKVFPCLRSASSTPLKDLDTYTEKTTQFSVESSD